MANQFEERIGQITLCDISEPKDEYDDSLVFFMNKTLGYPVKATVVGECVAWLAGLDDNYEEHDVLWAVDIQNQEVADLLNYLSSNDGTEDECHPGKTVLVLVPGYDGGRDVPGEADLIIISKEEWDRKVKRVRNLHVEIEDKIMKVMFEVKHMPDFSPKEEDMV